MGGADTGWGLRRQRMSLNAQLHVTGRDMESCALDLRWADYRWELEHGESSEELARKAVTACVWAAADFVKQQKCWQGTATKLLAAAVLFSYIRGPFVRCPALLERFSAAMLFHGCKKVKYEGKRELLVGVYTNPEDSRITI